MVARGSFMAFSFVGWTAGRFSCRFDRIFGAQRGFEAVETGGPGLTLALHPRGGVIERLGIERQEMIAPGDAPAHEPCTLENADVLGNGVERDCEWRGDFRDARIAGREALQDVAAGLVCERNQCVIQVHGEILTQKGEYCKRPIHNRLGQIGFESSGRAQVKRKLLCRPVEAFE